MEELGSRQQMPNYQRVNQRNETILPRTNSATQVHQYTKEVHYTSPLQEVQRRVLNDFAAQVQSTINQNEQYNEENLWERESVDSLEKSNDRHPQQIVSQQRIAGPIVRPNHIINISTKKTTQPLTKNSEFDSTTNQDELELMRQSYHESFFVKNTPVTGDEQVAAWLGANKVPTRTNKPTDNLEKPLSLDGNDPEMNGRPKSILKRSPSIDSNPIHTMMNKKPILETKQTSIPHKRPDGEKVVVKDSLEVKNAKLLKELETQVMNFTKFIFFLYSKLKNLL